MRLIRDKVLVKLSDNNKTPSGLVIEYDKKRSNSGSMRGTVLAVGDGHRTKKGIIPLQVQPGDKVIVHKWAGWEIMIDNEKYIIIKESHIMAVEE